MMVACLGGCPPFSNNNSEPNTTNNGGNGGGAGGGNTGGNGANSGGNTSGVKAGQMVVLGYNDLGMHCMNEDFSELVILPPFNTLHAQVIRRGEEPRLVTSGVTVAYDIPNNTTSVTKTNFWDYAKQLLGATLAPDVGLTGNKLSGTMKPTGDNDWSVTGIPVTPIDDSGALDPYHLAHIVVTSGGASVAETMAVVPVSWEIRCDLCHNTAGISASTDILRAHDRLHGTSLENAKPVLCSSCHADVALGQAGVDGVSNLSRAMHGAHASRMDLVSLTEKCYACHPGQETKCLRDVHFSAGMSCMDCHGSMSAVASATRRPWVDEPKCTDCHNRAGFSFEQTDTLFRDSVGHGNVHCSACHGSPHAITPTVVEADNIQARGLQGHPGVISDCTVCHIHRPDDSFFHHAGGESEGGDD
ncbi:MAG: cytochrome c3 family protein [Phycisphaerales bacterium]|nr:cytochrome c3 family protein [Phycisphaerales bacterium]